MAREDRLGSHGDWVNRGPRIPNGIHGGDRRLRRGSTPFGSP
jgi:hypothetical protein